MRTCRARGYAAGGCIVSMISKAVLRCLTAGLLLSGLSGCTYIKSLFPDKERDYQFTSEVPDLVIPDDLKNKQLASLPREAVAAHEAETIAAAEPQPSTGSTTSIHAGLTPAEIAAQEAAMNFKPEDLTPKRAFDSEEVAEIEERVSSDVSSLQIDQGKKQATRLVGKALTRKEVEIVERNIDRGYYYVKYDPYAVEARDDSIWDEFVFLFGDDPSQEQEYRITIRQIGAQLSEVTVQDSSGKNLSNPVANVLLKLITDGINEDLYSDGAENTAKAKDIQKKPENATAE